MNTELRDELIQVAAVAIAIITDLDQGNTQFQNSDYTFTDAHWFAMRDIESERRRQEDKWGAQHHDIYRWLAILGEEVGEANQAALEVLL